MFRTLAALLLALLAAGCNDIGSMRRRRDVEGLLVLLGHSDAKVRTRAVDALGYVGDSRAVDPLIKALHDPDSYVREHAARNLGCDYHSSLGCDSAKTVSPLIETLADEDPFVRMEAARSLGENPRPAAREPLEAVARQDPRWEVRHASVVSLARVGQREAIPVLEALLEDDEELVRVAARRGLRRLAATERIQRSGRLPALPEPGDEHIDDDDQPPARLDAGDPLDSSGDGSPSAE